MEEKDMIINDIVREVGESTATVECNIDSGAKGGVGKLLSVSASIKSVAVDKNGDTAKVMATLNCKVVFLTKSGDYDSFDYLCDFTSVVGGDNLQAFTHLWAVSGVADIDSSVMGDMIKIQAVVNIKVMGICQKQCQTITDIPQNVITKTCKMTEQTLVNTAQHITTLEESFDTGCTVDKIVYSDVAAMVSGVKTMDGKCLVSGNITGYLCYLSEGVLTSKSFNTPFSEEISLDGMQDDDKAMVLITGTDCKILLTGMEGDNVITMQVEVSTDVYCFRQNQLDVVVDAFMPEYEIEVTKCECSYPVFDRTYNLFDKIVGSAAIGDDMVAASKVICTSLSRNILINTYYDQGKMVVEGVLAANVVYMNVENNPQSLLVELPYSLQFDEVVDGDDKKLMAEAIVDNLYAKVKRDKEFEITANISIAVCVSSTEECDLVTELVPTATPKPCCFSIIIYVCKDGDDWWDVAKAVGAEPQSIMAQNADVDGDLCGKKIVYYRQING